jgi:hypothetical protein
MPTVVPVTDVFQVAKIAEENLVQNNAENRFQSHA